MPAKKLPSVTDIVAAWHSIDVEYGTRDNKARTDGNRYEVIVSPRDIVEPKVLHAYRDPEQATRMAYLLEDRARGEAVLKLLR